jgi:hypothetical protein
MSEVDRLFTEYVSQHGAEGDADPRPFLAQVSGVDRQELVVLIDGFLERAPRRAFDPAAFDGSRAELIVDELERSLTGSGGLWPAVLPQLRQRAGLRRATLVHQLAQGLGVAGREEKVAGYYHEMEQGLLPAGGVSDRVLAVLSDILGETVGALREAGRALAPSGGSGPAAPAAFARRAISDPAGPPSAVSSAAAADDPPDEVDRLFRAA